MIVAMTVHNRPDYLARTLESWQNARGIADNWMLFRCEPGCPEAVTLCHMADFAPRHVVCNEQRLGVLGNPWAAMEDGFALGDFVILAEEDLIVSPDVLEYFTWAQKFRDDPSVLGVTTYAHQPRPGGLAGAGTADWSADDSWHFWVWGTWKDRWKNLLRDTWDFSYTENGGGPAQRGWDWNIRNRFVTGAGMRMIGPSRSRSQHIGRYGGMHATPSQFEGLLSPSFAGLDVPPQEYVEVSLSHT